MNDLISRQAAIDALHMHLMYRMGTDSNKKRLDEWINNLPSVQPEKRTQERTETRACDLIDRQAAIDALNGIINRFEQILRDIRESKVDDSVCGMCEYDGAFVGQSGDWCNECPGFEKDDCFKLSDECRKRWLESVKLPPAQRWISCEERLPEKPGQYYVSGGDKVWICEFLIIATTNIPNFIGGWCNDVANPVVQAWMPIPESYREDTP